MYKRILVPIDGSRTSTFGFDEAIGLAKQQDADLCVLHVLDNRVLMHSVGIGPAGVGRLVESLRSSGKQLLARAETKARKHQVPVKTVLIENNVRSVADVIVKQARKWRADLIVIGTHGRRGVSRLVMGSDAEGVVRETTVPVLLVRSKPRRTS